MQGNDGHSTTTAEPAVLAPGNYDGVHRGHQVLIGRAKAQAEALGVASRVLTFDPHPAALLAPDRAPEPLTTPERRAELLRAHGVDGVEVVRFDHAYSAQSPEAFVDRLRAGGMRAIVVGHDFRFGQRAAGDTDYLREQGARHGFGVFVEEPVVWQGGRVSSTAVRQALKEGAVERAAVLQDRFHDISGAVVRGDQRGRTLGFPTLNVDGEPVLHPTDGVYAVMVKVDSGAGAAPGRSELLRGVANLGVRPTFAAGRSLEVHLLDFTGDLYGRRVRVAFVARLRGERSFDGRAALVAQIERDCGAARAALTDLDTDLDRAQGMLSWI